MAEGQIKWFDPKKGYGFLIGPEGQDVFIHFSQIRIEGFKTLKDGQQVTYELTRTDKGEQAHDVTPVDAEAPVDTAPTAEPQPSSLSNAATYESAGDSVA